MSPRRQLILSGKTSRIDRYGPIIFGDNSVVPAWVNVNININFTLTSVFGVCGASLIPQFLPRHSSELDISIIMWYQNPVPSIFTQLHIFTCIFGKVVVTTTFCIFSIVVTTAPNWRLLVYYVYF